MQLSRHRTNQTVMATKQQQGNLKPIRSTSEARRRGRNGGVKSGEARRAKKTLREAVLLLLHSKCTMEDVQAQMEALGLAKKDMTNQMAMVVSMFNEAMQGNVQAFNSLRDTAGEKPANITELTGKDGKAVEIKHEEQLTPKQAAAFIAELKKQI